MKDNTLNVCGTDVYENKIRELTDTFINQELADPDLMINGNSYVIDSLMDFIYNNLFKPDNNYVRVNNKLSILDYDDILAINDVWIAFKDILGRYGKKPTILRFSRMTGISRKQIQRWRDKDSTSLRSLTIEKWYSDCECSAHSGATESSKIGDIFDCKSNYGYIDQPRQQIEVVGLSEPRLNREEIASKYKALQLGEGAPEEHIDL